MDETGLPLVLSALLALGLLIAAGTDLKARIIPNSLVILVALAAPLSWWSAGLALWPGVAIQLASALVVFAVGAGLFAIGQMGGGDVKLLAALGLWFMPMEMLGLMIVMAVLGGVLTLVMLAIHKARKHEGLPEIPYGVAIAAAGIVALYQRNLNHFA